MREVRPFPESDVWTEADAEREAQDRKEPCPSCGNMQPVGTGPCVFGCESDAPVTATKPPPESHSCDDCGASASKGSWIHHNADCPRIAHIRRREQREHSRLSRRGTPAVRIPARVLGTRVYDQDEERYVDREYPA